VIVPAPYWVSYPEIVKLVDAKPVIIQTTEQNRFKATPAQLRKAITKKTKALIICSPSNPTGSMYTGEELREIAHLVRKHNVYVISDEIYEKVMYDGARHESIGAIEEIRDNVITVNGVSKAFSMTGWRIGYLGARRPIVEAAEKVQSQTTSNASSISQRAALAALNGGEHDVAAMREEFLKRRNFLYTALSSIPGIQCIKPDGAFYLFPNVSKFFGRTHKGKTLKSGDDIATYLLEEERVVVVPGSGFGAKKFIRLSYACSMHELEKAAERLKRGFELIR
jgi:aspartate aminotransferase